MEESQISISSSRNPDPDSIANREFPTVRRGYDPKVVKRFLAEVAQHLRSVRAHEADLLSRLAEAERKAQSPSYDEETLSAAVGSETARILHAAHAAGAEVLTKAEARAGQIVGEAEAAGREIRGRAETEGSTIIAEARQSAASALEAARADGRAMVEEAREIRRKILGDLTERRRALAGQIEQLQAGKDSLYSAVAHVAEAIADVRARLTASDEEARSAAELARRRTEIDRDDIERDKKPVREPATLGGRAGRTPALVAPVEHAVPPSAVIAKEAAPAAATDGAVQTPESAETEVVDELFAKLRAAAADGIEAEPKTRHRRSRSVERADQASRARSTRPASASNEIVTGRHDHRGTPNASEITEDSLSSARVEVLRERDGFFGEPRDEVVHELKRALRVEQNELLDRLRSLRRGTNPVEVISIEASAKGLAEATAPGLAAAFRAGARFGSEHLGASAAAIAPGELDAAAHSAGLAAADRLGGEIASSVARRLEDALRPGASESGSFQNAVGAVYRDWKGERVEDVAADHAVASFSEGVVAVATRSGVGISWIADDGALRCSDCDDDELAGVVAVGTTFPTGQTHPPAHGGCRCVIVPAAK